MKLLNKSLIYLSVTLFFVIGLWSVFFYFNLLQEIKRTVDEGLENYKRQIIYQSQKDTTILNKSNFDEGFFTINEISKAEAIQIKDTYYDTLMLMQDADDEAPELEPVRLLQTAFECNDRYFELQIINSMVEEDDLVKELFQEALVLYFLLIIIILLINNIVLKRLWAPFYSFLSQLKSYRVGRKFPQVQTSTQEFNDLQHALHILLQTNLELYDKQKEFIGNASHELQTPLAIATNKLELLIEKAELDTEQAQSISDVMNIIERLVRLNKSLLLLTKIENKQFLDNQRVSLNKIVHQSVYYLEEIADYKNIGIEVIDKAELSVEMDPSLATIIISNLLRNAIFHNIEHGCIVVELVDSSIKVSNTGVEAPIDQNKLFTRFHKSENNSNGSGLGLAIIKAICDLYEFPIAYHYENKLHSFEVRLK